MKPNIPFLIISLLILNACAPELPRQTPPATSSEAAMAASMASGVAQAAGAASSAVAASAAVSASAASAAAASATAASAPEVPESKLHKTKKVVIGGSDEFGNTTYYFPASIKKQGKLYHVLTENRFKTAQKLPESGKPFLYSLIKEAVDCQRKLTDPILVTHFSEKDEVVETHKFEYPDYDSWSELELESLANEHPDRPFIDAVCQGKK